MLKNCRGGWGRAGLVVILALLVGACADQTDPAPVFQRGDAGPPMAPMGLSPMPPPSLQVTVKRGQTLDGYAYTYHVPKAAIIAANGLRPPYQLKTGQRLTIPAAGSMQQASTRPAMPPPVAAAPVAPPQAAIPQPPATPQTIAPPSGPPSGPSPGPPSGKATPDVIPLDGPAPPKQAAAAPPATLTPPAQPAAPLSAPPPAAPQASGETGSGRFPWPVRGKVLANYGNTPGGGHNDGINIGAPRGTPVRAVDGGTVAYSGNEVKGYGNIVLIKHPNGWISAYAHLEDVTVKPGEAIAAGQVIAKVGNSGGVAEPQLHFELRRGKRAVDPKEFLAPAPSAAAPTGNKAG